MSKLHLIVEGEGDALALPVLVRKILSDNALDHIQLTRPQISGDIRKVFKRLGDFMGYGLKNACPILWVLDCDDKIEDVAGCPVRHVTNLRAAMEQQQIHQSQPVEFAFFTKEFESLFLAEQHALKDFYRLPDTLEIDAGAVLRRDAKGEISKLLGKDRGYKETIDQAKLAARLDLPTCRAVSRDYRHFEDAILRLCNTQ
ncbi:MAG: DUF4276 family protein [Rhodoferax sp.]|nr:DUF4276 family protein [Rhodoferax sp.]MDP3650700.1 DUF4276 family protein [Rhodoferax sp.]